MGIEKTGRHGETRSRRWAGATLVVLAWLAASLAPVHAQVTVAPPPPAAPPGPIAVGLESEGRVTRVDRAARTITLDTGQDYVIPPGLDAAWAAVQPGSELKIRYNVDGGRNIATQLQVVR